MRTTQVYPLILGVIGSLLFGHLDISANSNKLTTHQSSSILAVGKILGKVWQDIEPDIDHTFQAGEDQLLEGVEVQLLDGDGNFISSTQTDSAGCYSFRPLEEGSYQIMFLIPDNLAFVQPHIGDDKTVDSDVVDLVFGKTPLFFLAQDEQLANIDAGLRFKTLAVHIIEFRGHWDQSGQSAIIEWQVDQVSELESIQILRAQGRNETMQVIKEFTVFNEGTTLDLTRFEDEEIYENDDYYYQVKLIGSDGIASSSDIISVTASDLTREIIPFITYPNPTSDELIAKVHLLKTTEVSFELYNTQGKLVNVWKEQTLDKGQNLIALDLYGAESGRFLIKANIGIESFHQLVVAY